MWEMWLYVRVQRPQMYLVYLLDIYLSVILTRIFNTTPKNGPLDNMFVGVATHLVLQ